MKPGIEAGEIGSKGDYQHRLVLHGEVHARPHELLETPFEALHLALLTGESGAGEDQVHLAELCRLLGVAVPEIEGNFQVLDLPGFRLRWERHTEFSTWTLFRSGGFDQPFTSDLMGLLPADWRQALPGQLLLVVRLALESADREPEELDAYFKPSPRVGSRVMGGAATLWTDFRLHDDGMGRFLVHDWGLSKGQAGRLVQRLFEIETYRMMALLALPKARDTAPEATKLDRDLKAIVAELASPRESDDRQLLERLTALAAESERLGSATAYRFSAASAYYALVRRRIEELMEERISGVQTLGEFMERRLAPAMATCTSTSERLSDLSARVARAGDLLRTRVDIALEEKNRDLLHSMNRRAKLQLRLQETVEGLSIAAISYYLVGLVGYGAKGIKAAGIPIDPDMVQGLSVPVALALVALGLWRLKKHLHQD
ncbi:MAG: DUF3422 domain-containing protein [Alphaproteobacteria bacterium]|nr:DUF3422 domain-containing protein [Alphaproteobacteria bacterium]